MSLDKIRTELVRANGFNKASATQLSKVLALVDAQITDPPVEEPPPVEELPVEELPDEEPPVGPEPEPPPPPAAVAGVLIGRDELMALPTSGRAWESVYGVAASSWGTGNIADQDSDHDVKTLAGALVAARTGEFMDKTRASLMSIIGTEFNPQSGSQWLAVSRNMAAYTIAADLIGMRSDPVFHAWMEGWRTKEIVALGDPRTISGFDSGSNASSQEGFFHACLAVYLDDADMLAEIWAKFQRFVGDPAGPLDPKGINLSQGIGAGWSHDPDNAVAINPKGTTKNGVRIDGAIINDMRRGGDFKHPPGYTQYPWTGTDGLVPAALVLHRAGYPAFEIADQAIRRVMEYLHWLRVDTGHTEWFSGTRGQSQIHIVNWFYRLGLPIQYPVGVNRCVGFLDWTHPIP